MPSVYFQQTDDKSVFGLSAESLPDTDDSLDPRTPDTEYVNGVHHLLC